MTLAELRIAYNEACRNPNRLEAFALEIMPKVFALLEVCGDKRYGVDVGDAAINCRNLNLPEKKHQPERYTGGR